MDVNKKVVQYRRYLTTYTLVIKQVKNINMRISSKGKTMVSANPFVPVDKADDFVSSEVSWIVKYQKSVQERSQKSMTDDKHITLFENSPKIRKTTRKHDHVSYDKDTPYVQCREQADPEKAIWQPLDRLCRDVFLNVTTLTFRSLSDYHPEFPGVKIRDIKSRWGDCTPAENSITLDRKPIHYPFEFIEYVVLYEFVHFIQPNHSKAFCNITENHIPDYKTCMEMISQEKEEDIMAHIVTNAFAFFMVARGNDIGAHVTPLCASIQDEHYRDLCFGTSSFLGKVRSGGIPTTSQPSVGDALATYEEHSNGEILSICMADGPSGAHQTALMVKEQAPNADSVAVLNSQTLCGPHRYLVEKAVKFHDEGKKVADIVAALEGGVAYGHSFLVPQDYSFLKRDGRLKPAAAGIGGLSKLKSVMYAVGDGSRLDEFTVTHTLSKAADFIISYSREHGADTAYRISVPHADVLADARFLIDRLKNAFLGTELELLKLLPASITQGGPQCITIQCTHKQSGNTLSLYRRLYVGKQDKGSRCSLAGYVVLVVAAGSLLRSTLSLPDWFQEYEGDTLWSMIMYGIFVLLFPEARVELLSIATLLFSYLIECLQLLDYDWLNTLCATPLRYLLRQDFIWSDLLCYSTGCMLAYSLDMIVLERRHGIYG